MNDPLQFWAAWASIAGLAVSLWAAIAATTAKKAAEQAREEIRRKVFQYSISAARQQLDQLDDTVINRHFSFAAHLARSLADTIDEISNTPEFTDESIGENARGEWKLIGTELREWRTKFVSIPSEGRNRKFDNIDGWSKFTARVKDRMNIFLGPLAERR